MSSKNKETKSVPKSLAEVKKLYKSLIEDLSIEKTYDAISSGSLIVNGLIGSRCPGVPRGRITEICGPEASSKTTMAIHSCVEAQKQGLNIAYLDFERAFDPYYARDCGLNIGDPKFMLTSPEDFEQGQEMATALVQTGEIGLIVFDSVAAMTPRSEREGGGRSIGLLARLLSGFLGSFSKDVSNTHTAAIFINQLRMKIPQSKFERPEEYSTGGKALQFYNSLKIRTAKIGIGKSSFVDPVTHIEKEEVDRIKVRIDIVKNKLGRPFRRGEIWVRLGKGIDNLESLIEIAKGRGLILSKGAWNYIQIQCDEYKPGEKKCQGGDELKAYLAERPHIQKALLAQIDGAFDMSPQERVAVEEEEREEGIVEDDGNGPIQG